MTEGDSSTTTTNTIFSVPAFFIFLRETVEAAVILGVLLAFLNKLVVNNDTLLRQLKRQVWIGTLAGVVLSVIIGVVFVVVWHIAKVDIWHSSNGAFGPIFEAVFMYIAVLIISIMAFTMLRIQNWQHKWAKKLEQAATDSVNDVQKKKFALVFLPFTIVLREGLESVLLLGGTSSQYPPTSVILPAVIGIIAGSLIGYMFYRAGSVLAIRYFFMVSTIFLLFIGAGLFSQAAHEIEEVTGETAKLWEIEDPTFNPKKNGFFGVMKAIFGYTHEATVATTVSYFGYWLIMGIGLIFVHRRESKKAEEYQREQSNKLSNNDTWVEKEKEMLEGKTVVEIV
ncbi:iron permease FTR1/Fip1/EfeU [Paraphysoderma sedebokerense]|nr:iron permease FTR1/Fip1/EfeU [Paraphysoderma sedebokerense]